LSHFQFLQYGGYAHWYTSPGYRVPASQANKLTTLQCSMEELVSSRSAMPPRYIA
jgi:hypothetical protein